MPDFEATISGYAVGDALEIRRTINRTESGLDSGLTITKAWLTIKTDPSISDADDSNALVQKEITTTDVSGTGQIENDGGGDVDPVLRFDLTPTDTRDIGVTHRKYDIQVLTSNNDPYTGEKGEIWGTGDVTITDN